MYIIKEFRIQEVIGTRASNAPFKIVLEGAPFERNEESSLVLDENICNQYNIPMSLGLVGRTIACSFESRELPLGREGQFKDVVDGKSLESDDLEIKSLENKEVTSPMFGRIPPSKYMHTSRTLKLSSFGGGDGMHFNIMPCPFYNITLNLTADEYGECKALGVTAVFKVSFNLKPQVQR